jgi:hypothetical protein
LELANNIQAKRKKKKEPESVGTQVGKNKS